jgi:hypothetical protein
LKKSIDNVKNSTLSALLKLLEDENLEIASLAMEQFLEMGPLTDETIAEYQESHTPQLRHRIHQLSSILTLRRRRDEFIDDLANSRMSLWEGLIRVNSIYDPTCPVDGISDSVADLAKELKTPSVTTTALTEFMRDQEFAVPSEDLLDADLYLVERVLGTRYGATALLCALAQRIGTLTNWESTICLHEGRFCLLDRQFMLIDPGEGWNVTTPEGKDRYHICSRKDVLLAVLCQLFLVGLVDGNLRDLHQFGMLLTGLNHDEITELPFPVGAGPLPV